MADDLDQGYIQTRQTMREYQSRMLMEPVQQGSDVYMGAKEGGKPQEGKGVAPTTPTEPTGATEPVTLAPDATVPPEQPVTQQPNTITVDRPEVAAVRQNFKEQTKPYVFDLDTFDVPGDVIRAGLAKLSGVDRGANEGNIRMSADEMVNRVFFQYGEKPEEVIKRAEELGLPEADTLKIMAGLSAVVLGMATDPLNVTPGGKAKDVAKVAEVAGRSVATVGKATPRRSYDEIQKAIDALEDKLEAQGLDPVKMYDPTNPQQAILKDAGYQPEPPELTALYKERFAVEAMEKGQFVEVVSKQTGLPPEEAKAALSAIHIKPEQMTAHFANSLKDWGKETHVNIENLYNHFARHKSQEGDALATFRWGGTADNPQLIGETIGKRPLDQEVLRKVERVYNAVAENIGYGKVSLTKHEKSAGLLDDGKTIDVKAKVIDEFKRAAQILKSERGSVPLGGGGSGKPPEVPPVSVGAAAEQPMNAKQLATIAKREESKQAHQFSLEGFQAELTKQRRGPVLSDEAVRQLAGQSGFTLQDLLDLKPGSVLAPEIQVKAREVYKATVDNMKQSAKAYLATGSPQDFEEFAHAFTMAGLSTTRIIGTYSEAGRTFRLLNQKYPSLKKPGAAQATDPEFSIQDQYIQEMYKFFRSVEEKSKMGGFDQARTGPGMGPGGMVSPGQLAQMVVDLPSEEAMMAFAKAALKPTWGDMFYEIWVNGLLSGPITHSTNIISNAATLLWNIPERQVASLIKPGSVRPGEAAAMVGGVLESVGDAWRLAWKAFKEDAPQFGASKLENMPRKAITADALELTGSVGAAVDFLGNAIRLPGRFLMAGDDFFKSIAFRAELRSLAKRQAFREVNELGLTGKEAARKAKEIEQKILTDPPETIKQDAQEFAAYTTFTRELGTAGSAVQMAIQNVPFGRVVLPFIRTPANIFKFAGERTPLALASKAVRDELAAGGERQALALAKIGLGSMTMAFMASLAANGLITGGGPKDKVLRKQLELEGWQPYSFKVGNEYVSFARIEPLGSLIGMAADAADLMGQLGQKDSAELASALTVAISRNVANKTFVKGLAGTLNAVTSQDVHVVKSFLEKELPTLMPYSSAMGQTAKNVDPVMRDVQSILDAFKAKVPGFSDELPPQRNLYGDKVLLQGGMGPDLFSPLYVREIKDDPVAHELNRLAYPFTMPSRHIDGIQLTPKLYDRYAELSGKGSELTGRQSLHDALHETMRQGIYKQAADGPDGGKVVLLKATINRFREMAALQLEQENKDFAQARQMGRMRAATKFDQNARTKQGPAPVLQ